MKIGRQFNTFTQGEYTHLLANYKKYTDFNHLGLFRSIVENDRLMPGQRTEVRDAAIRVFPKFFEFLQLKDPHTYFSLSTLNKALTVADEQQAWEDIRRNQQQLLAAKRINHRNIGTYAKHDCGYDTCKLNGLMLRQGSPLAERNLWFCSDKNRYQARLKSDKQKRDRKHQRSIVEQDMEGNII